MPPTLKQLSIGSRDETPEQVLPPTTSPSLYQPELLSHSCWKCYPPETLTGLQRFGTSRCSVSQVSLLGDVTSSLQCLSAMPSIHTWAILYGPGGLPATDVAGTDT
ncbi:hypothetical protein JZ751_001010, partial [Albula glossodonta]